MVWSSMTITSAALKLTAIWLATAPPQTMRSGRGWFSTEVGDQPQHGLAGETAFAPPQTLQLGFYHATRTGFDVEFPLQRATQNKYVGKLPALSAGAYHLQLTGDDWRLTGTLTGPHRNRVELKARCPPHPECPCPKSSPSSQLCW